MVVERYILPYFDISLELHNNRQSVIATDYQMQSKSIVFDFARDYPESQQQYNGESINAIGYEIPEKQDEFYEDEEESVDKTKIGFRREI